MSDMAMRWSALLSRSGIGSHAGGDDPLVTDVVDDSRAVRPGACFVAVQGTRVDGHNYVAAAVRAGAAVVVTQRPVEAPPGVVHLQLASTRGVVGRLLGVLTGLDELQRTGRFNVLLPDA
jgi:UDP-N-acetylmuramyl pentapeptide synthase